jgi:hypothetical protein
MPVSLSELEFALNTGSVSVPPIHPQKTISFPGTSMKTFSDFIAAGNASTSEALALFDSLDTTDTDFMIGSWKGGDFITGHALNGVLEVYHWHGKRFESLEQVHPLVFTRLNGTKASVNPALVPMSLMNRFPVPRAAFVGRLFQFCMPLFTTSSSRARLRMTSYRGKLGATMIYDDLPINDVFRKVDDNTLLGIMDLKGMEQPLFFVLRRE